MKTTLQLGTTMTERPTKVHHDFMEISTDEMNTSIGIAETYLGKFKVGNRCHWGLRPNADKVLRLIASIILTKKLHLKILERPITRREYSEFRDHALTILGNTRALSPL